MRVLATGVRFSTVGVRISARGVRFSPVSVRLLARGVRFPPVSVRISAISVRLPENYHSQTAKMHEAYHNFVFTMTPK